MINKIIKPKESFEIEKAIIFLIKHMQESGRNPKPVILHSIRIGCKLMELDQSKDVVIAGILHDVVEDSDCTNKEVEKIFGKKVSQLVAALTFDSLIKNYKKRWQKMFKNIIKAGKSAMLIKLVDVMDNYPYYKLISNGGLISHVWKNKFALKQLKPYLGKLRIFQEHEKRVYNDFKN